MKFPEYAYIQHNSNLQSKEKVKQKQRKEMISEFAVSALCKGS